MFDFIKKSLRNKLLLTFLWVGLLPVMVLFIYILFLSQEKIMSKSVEDEFNRVDVIANLINENLDSLFKEVKFLGSLDLMDDILADDVDKRISRLLKQKKDDLSVDATLISINNKATIIASSEYNDLLHKFKFTKQLNKKDGFFIVNNYLYLYSKIYSSFDMKKNIGYLILKYNIKNLDTYLSHNKHIHSFILDDKYNIVIGKEKIKLNIDKDKDIGQIINVDHLIVYKKINSFLENYYIVYAVDKSLALAFLYDFIQFMIYMSLVIVILIVFIAIRFSKNIVKPIENLTKIVKKTIQTKNYSATLKIDSKDEIAILTNSFNELFHTTDKALNDLQEESKLRLKRFVQLIDVFNTIIQTQNENDCIDTSIEQINNLTQKNNLYFEKSDIENVENGLIPIYITDFDKHEKIPFGSIKLGFNEFEDINEKRFYYSIATMIMLQLDRINLINKTMSASKAKSAFISNMSHELRTPLNAIIGFSQYMISYEEMSDDQIDTISNIESSAQYLLGMINEILDIAKIEAGKMEAHPEMVNVLDLLNSTYNMLKPLADDKGLEFLFLHENFEDKEYFSDPKMFKQIVVNMISNAIKFTQEGSVTLSLYLMENKLFVSVKDSGIGISEEDIKRLFNDFTQVENVMQKKHKGTGLGLSLSKKMANILGGDVNLKSDGEGEGTTSIFWIKI